MKETVKVSNLARSGALFLGILTANQLGGCADDAQEAASSTGEPTPATSSGSATGTATANTQGGQGDSTSFDGATSDATASGTGGMTDTMGATTGAMTGTMTAGTTVGMTAGTTDDMTGSGTGDTSVDTEMTESSGSGDAGDSSTDSDNSVPEVADSRVQTENGNSVDIRVEATDADGDELSYELVSGPTHGQLVGELPDVRYEADADYVGEDSFVWKASDGIDESAPATVTIEIAEFDGGQPPTADDKEVNVAAGGGVSVTLSGQDPEGRDLGFRVIEGPSNGAIEGSPPRVRYVPDPGFGAGEDSFQYVANDGHHDSEPATVRVNVLSNNSAPKGQDQSRRVVYQTPTTLFLSATDADRDGLIYTIVDYPEHGTLSDPLANPDVLPEVVYDPDDLFRGYDSFTFKVSDGMVESAPATVSIRIGSADLAPVVEPTSFEVPAGGVAAVSLEGSDDHTETLDYSLAIAAEHGVVTIRGDQASYSADAGFVGKDEFYVRAYDGTFHSEMARVQVLVGSDNQRPVAYDASYAYRPGDRLVFDLVATDADGDALTYRLLNQPDTGTLTGELPHLVFRTGVGVGEGETSFNFIAFDGKANSRPATVTIRIKD